MFVGVYEPTKQKLLKILPENLSAVAHLVMICFSSPFVGDMRYGFNFILHIREASNHSGKIVPFLLG